LRSDPDGEGNTGFFKPWPVQWLKELQVLQAHLMTVLENDEFEIVSSPPWRSQMPDLNVKV
jgi:hypothetical protein